MVVQEKYRADIDGLRALAILSVIFFHAFPHLVRGGFVGVDVFFVISGFLITGILIENLENARFSLKDFYQKRVNRIFPALILILLFCLLFGWFALYPFEYKELGEYIAGGAGFISNLLLWHNTGYFDTAAESKPLLHLWSLGIEEQFYIVWPLFIWFAWKKKFNVLLLVSIVIVLSFFLNIKTIASDPVASFFSPFTRFWELLLGSFLAYINFYQTCNHYFLNHQKLLKDFFSMIGLFILISSVILFTNKMAFPGAWALFPTLGSFLLIIAGPKAWVNRKILANKTVVAVGLISYPLYLWHWPLLSFARIMEERKPSSAIRILIVLLSLCLAWLTYRYLEKPLRKRRTKKYNAELLTLILFSMGFIGLFLSQYNGFNLRHSDELAVLNLVVNPQPVVKESYECVDVIPFFKKIYFNGGCQLTKRRMPDVAFIGDSHALQYKNAIWQLFPNKSVLLVAQTSCLPFSSDYFLKGDCREKYDALLTYLKENKSIKEVYLTGYWSYLMTGAFGERGFNWRHAAAENPARSISFIANGKHFIAELTKANKKVIFLKDIPDLDFNVTTCFDTRPFRLHRMQINHRCAIDFNTYQKRMQEYDKVIAEMLVDFPQVKIYNPRPLFCHNNTCMARDDKFPYYFNGDHLNYYGANMVIKDLRAIF